jgi:hypothetical protein
VGSDFTWNAQGIVSYRLPLRGLDVLVGAGYRALYWDYEDDDFKWDVTMSGPMIGAAIGSRRPRPAPGEEPRCGMW